LLKQINVNQIYKDTAIFLVLINEDYSIPERTCVIGAKCESFGFYDINYL